ncbi:hypothetical protein GON09_005673 [Rhodococcus sp. B50]|nr:hypothetical protein [Rhodococcus sp. B50]
MILEPIRIEDTPTVSCQTTGLDRGGLTGAGNARGDDRAPATALDAVLLREIRLDNRTFGATAWVVGVQAKRRPVTTSVEYPARGAPRVENGVGLDAQLFHYRRLAARRAAVTSNRR